MGQAPTAGVKHTRMIFNPDNGRLYTMSGDWSGQCTATTPGNCVNAVDGSYRNEIYSYSVGTNTWARETDYCMFPNLQPAHHAIENGGMLMSPKYPLDLACGRARLLQNQLRRIFSINKRAPRIKVELRFTADH